MPSYLTNLVSVQSILLIAFFNVHSIGQNRAPSLYLNYQDNHEGDIIINTLRVADPSPLYTYYCGLLWNPGLDAGGYCGMQEHPDGRNFIYSLWDPISSNDAITTEYVHPSTDITNFGGEGTGLRSLNFGIGWEVMQWYSLVSRTWSVDNESTLFGFWVYDETENTWHHLVTMKYPVPNLEFSTGTRSFIEDWLGNGSEARTIHHKNGWKRNSSNNEWFAFESSSFDRVFPDAGTVNFIEKYNGGIVNDDYYFMTSGGNTVPIDNEEGTLLFLDNSLPEPNYSAGQVIGLQVNKNLDEVALDWDVDSSLSPQFSYHIRIYDNINLSGIPIIAVDNTTPHLRSHSIDISGIQDDKKYYVEFFIKDLFDNQSQIVVDSFIKGQLGNEVVCEEATISCGETYNNSINTSDDDIYSFHCGFDSYNDWEDIIRVNITSVPATITLTGMTADLDMFLYADCTTGEVDGIENCIDQSRGGGDEQFDPITTTGVYWVIIESFGGATSPYTLSVNCGGSLDCSNARPLSCGQSELFGTFNEPRDVDSYCNGQNTTLDLGEVVYVISTPIGPVSSYTFSLTGVNPSTDLDLFLLGSCDPDDCIADSDGSSSATPDLITVDLGPGVYYLVVDTDGQQESNYTITMSCGGSLDCSNARPLSCGQSELFGTFNEPRDVDSYCNGQNTTLDLGEVVYVISTPIGPVSSYTFNLTGVNPSTDLDMFLLGSCDPDDCIADSDGSSSATPDVITVNLGPGVYYLIVDTDGQEESNYTIAMSCGGGDCDEEIFCGETKTLTTAGSGNDIVSNNCRPGTFQGDDMVVKFEHFSGVVNWVTLWNTNRDLDIFLFSDCPYTTSNPTCLGWSTNSERTCSSGSLNYETIVLDENDPPGTYYILVDGKTSTDIGTFNLSLSCEGLFCDDDDPLECGLNIGDTSDDPNLSSNYVDCYDNTGCFNPGNTDNDLGFQGAFTGGEEVRPFTALETGTYTFTMQPTGSDNDDLELFLIQECCETMMTPTGAIVLVDAEACYGDSNCEQGSTNGAGASETISFFMNAGETIYLVVDGFLGDEGPYTLTVDCGGGFCNLFPPSSENDFILTLDNPDNFEVRSVTLDYPFSAMDTGDFTFQDSIATNSLTDFEYFCPEPGCYYVCVWYFDAANNFTSCCFKYCVEAPRYDCAYPQLEFSSENTVQQTETYRILCFDPGNQATINAIVADSTRVLIDDIEINPNGDGEYFYEFPYGSYTVCCWTYDALCDTWNICCKDVCIPYIPEADKCDENFDVIHEIDPNDPRHYTITVPQLGGNTCDIESISPPASITSLGNCQFDVQFPADGVYKICYYYADNLGYCCEYICIDQAALTCESSFDFGLFYPNQLVLQCNEEENFRKWTVTKCTVCHGFDLDDVTCYYNPNVELEMEAGFTYLIRKTRKECCEEGDCGECIDYEGFNCSRYQPHYISEASSTNISYEFNFTSTEDLTLEYYTIFDEDGDELISNTTVSNDIVVDFSALPGFVPDRTYVICYAFRDAITGCLRICYEKYRIYNPFTCSYIQPNFLGNPDNQSTSYGFELSSAAAGLQVKGWTIYDDNGAVVQGGFGQDQNISWASPDGGIYWICVYLYDPVFDCYQVCYYKFNTWYPYNCGYVNATFNGNPNQNSYQFSLSDEGQQQGLEVIEWTMLEEDGQTVIQSSSNPINQVFTPGVTRVICALIYDPFTGCYSICYYKIRLDNPWDACNAFSPSYDEDTGQLSINANGAFQNSYAIVEGVGYTELTLVDIPLPTTDSIEVCYYYFDGFCWRVCCKEVCVRNCDPIPPCPDSNTIGCDDLEDYSTGLGVSGQSSSWAAGFTGTDCLVQTDMNGNQYIEVGVDQNFNACSSVFTLPADGNVDEVKLTMDLFLPGIPIDNYNGLAIEVSDNSGNLFQINFQPGTFAQDPQIINFGIQGDMVPLNWLIGDWFDLDIVLNKSASTLVVSIRGQAIYSTSTLMTALSSIELNGNLSQNAGVDNICLESCGGMNPVPPSPPADGPCQDFVGDACEDFQGYTPTGTCNLVELGGDNVLEVTTFGPNLENCEETFVLSPPAGAESIMSFDIYVQEGAIMVGVTEDGVIMELSFQPGGSVNLTYDGDTSVAVPIYSTNTWINVVLEFDETNGMISGTIDGVMFFRQSVPVSHLTSWNFYGGLSTAPNAYYVDNFCYGYCGGVNPPECYTDCCPSGTDLSWLDNIIISLDQDCSDPNLLAGSVYVDEWNGQCSYVVWSTIPVMLFANELTYYDCDGNVLNVFTTNVASDIADLIGNMDLVWNCINRNIPECPPVPMNPCPDFVGALCEDFSNYTPTGTCQVVSIGGDNVLEVTTFGPNQENCEETTTLSPPQGVESILSFDIYVQEGAIMEGVTEDGVIMELAFQPGGPVNLTYDGDTSVAVPIYSTKTWINVVLEFDETSGMITGTIDGVMFFRQAVTVTHITSWSFYGGLSTAPNAYYVDNFCYGYCEECLPPVAGGPYDYDCDLLEISTITPDLNNITFSVGNIMTQRIEIIDSLTGNVLADEMIVPNSSYGTDDFEPGRTYIVCLYYFDADGCLRRCCKKIYIPEECSLFSPYFSGDENNLDFIMSPNLEDTNLIVDSWWYDGQDISDDNEAMISFPIPGNYWVCCLLYDPITMCYTLCCRELCIDNPLDCDAIQVDYDIVEQEYILTAEGVQEVLSWNIDIPTNIPDNGFIGSDNPQRFNPQDFNIAAGQAITISVRYLDADGCLKICCKELCPPVDPTEVCDFITPVYLGQDLNFNFTAEGTTGISELEWRLHIPGGNETIDIGSGFTSEDLDFDALIQMHPSLMLDKVCISLSYKDDVSGCYKICCKCFCIADSPLLCDDIITNYIFDELNPFTYEFELDVQNAEQIEWTLDNLNIALGTDPNVIVNFEDFGFGAGDQVFVTVRYYDSDTECFRVCCKAICLESPTMSCNLISVDGPVNGIFDLSFAGNTTSVSWFVENSLQTGNGENFTLDANQLADSVVRVCVTYLDTQGCLRICCTEIDTDLMPLSTSVTSDTICITDSNGMLEVIISGGTPPYEIVWNTGDTNVNLLTGLGVGSYMVTVTDADQNMQVETTSISAFLEPEVTIETSPADCISASGTAMVSVENGVEIDTYTWLPINQTTQVNSIDGLEPGDYSVILDYSDGCMLTVDFEVVAEGELEFDLGDDLVICDDTNRTLAYIPNGSEEIIEWSRDGQVLVSNSNFVEADISGQYELYVLDEDGCEGRDTVMVDYFDALVCRPIRFTVDPSNSSDIVFTQDITNGVLYEWDFGDGETLETNSEEVTYSYGSSGSFTACLTVTDACGEMCTQCVTLSTDSDELALDAIVIDGGCGANPEFGSIELLLSGGAPPYQINWDTGQQNLFVISNLEAGTYTVTITDSNNVSVVETFDVQVFLPIICRPIIFDVDQSNSNIFIFNQDIENGISYEWDFGDGTTEINDSSQVEHEFASAGIYTACLTVTNECDERCTQCVTLGSTIPALDAVVTDGGCDVPLGSIELLISGMTQPVVIVWDNGASTDFIEGLETGSYNVTLTDANNIELTGSYDITVFESIICRPISFEIDSTVSNGIIFNQDVENGQEYTWDFGDGTLLISNDSNVAHTYPDQAGLYTACLSVTDNCDNVSCIQCVSIGIGALNVTATQVDPICDELGSLDLLITGGTGPYEILWDDGFAELTKTDLDEGIYTVTVTDQIDGSTSQATFQLISAADNLITQGDTLINAEFEDVLELSVLGAFSTQWTSDDFILSCETCLTTSFEVTSPGTVSATAVDSNGCFTEIIFTINITTGPLFGPNMITPNQDGYNDALEFVGIENFPNNKLTIFNRWGEVLLEQDNYVNEWTGQKQNKDLPDGVYYYILEYGIENNNEFILKRDLLIIRER